MSTLPAPPLSPAPGSPARAPGSMRRTSHLDVELHGPGLDRLSPEAGFVDVAAELELHVAAAARDLATHGEGDTEVLAEQRLALLTDERRRIRRIDTDPHHDDADGLVGAAVGAGFRTAVSDLLEEHAGTPYALLLFDLPTIGLISGFAVMQMLREADADPARVTPPELLPHVTDVCAGWAEGTSLVSSVAAGEGVPFRAIAPAPALEPADDPAGWHEVGPLATHAMRRRRRIDVHPEGHALTVDAMFRDTYGDPDEGEIVLHEYGVTARFESAGDRRLLAIEAEPRVLPQRECPLAVGNLSDLVGTSAADLVHATRSSLGGPRGCTHLNDLINALPGVVLRS